MLYLDTANTSGYNNHYRTPGLMREFLAPSSFGPGKHHAPFTANAIQSAPHFLMTLTWTITTSSTSGNFASYILQSAAILPADRVRCSKGLLNKKRLLCRCGNCSRLGLQPQALRLGTVSSIAQCLLRSSIFPLLDSLLRRRRNLQMFDGVNKRAGPVIQSDSFSLLCCLALRTLNSFKSGASDSG